MKIIYLMTLLCFILAATVVYQSISQRQKASVVPTEATQQFDEQCTKLGGTTYVVDNIDNNYVFLCVDTDVFLLEPFKLVDKPKKEVDLLNVP